MTEREVERVARAIYAEQNTSGRSFDSIRQTDLGYRLFRYARAAITALRQEG